MNVCLTVWVHVQEYACTRSPHCRHKLVIFNPYFERFRVKIQGWTANCLIICSFIYSWSEISKELTCCQRESPPLLFSDSRGERPQGLFWCASWDVWRGKGERDKHRNRQSQERKTISKLTFYIFIGLACFAKTHTALKKGTVPDILHTKAERIHQTFHQDMHLWRPTAHCIHAPVSWQTG